MNVGEPRLETTCKGLIRQESVEIHRRFGNADPVPLGRHRGMEVGEGAAIVEPCAFWPNGIDQLENTVGTVDEPAQDSEGIDDPLITPSVEPALAASAVFSGRSIDACQEVAGIEQGARFRD